MAYESARVSEIVERSFSQTWSVPDFQRGFVWKPGQVRDLADSLWQSYPIGHLLIWNSQSTGVTSSDHGSDLPHLWIVDGQQRSTALCILFGKKPNWWKDDEEWQRLAARYDVRFDVAARQAPFSCVANNSIRNEGSRRYVPMNQLLNLDTSRPADQAWLQQLAQDIVAANICGGEDALTIYSRLDRVRAIRDRDLVIVTMDHELEDVVEVFARLNSRGTRVTEADIYLGVISARAPGWVRQTFLPFLERLAFFGYELPPSLVFRTLTAVGATKVRFTEIPDAFWEPGSIDAAWTRMERSWRHLIAQLRGYGIASREILPNDASLVLLVSLMDRFPDEPIGKTVYLLLQTARFNRYSSSATSALESDLREIAASASLDEASERILGKLPYHSFPILAEDFLKDHSESRFGRLLLYLLVYQNIRGEWPEGHHKVGIRDVELRVDFRPEWHHIFTPKSLQGVVDEDSIDALANFAVGGPALDVEVTETRKAAISRYRITEERLREQYISNDVANLQVEEYGAWLNERATLLAWAANNFLRDLREEGLEKEEAIRVPFGLASIVEGALEEAPS